MGLGWMCVFTMQRERAPMVIDGRGLLVCDTKPLLCNHLGVKSPLCGPHKGWQRQGAGGWGGSAATQLWAEPTHPGSIWALLISVATWPLLPPGPRDNGGPRQTPLLQTFSEFLFRLNLKYFIRPPSPRSLSFTSILKSITRTSPLNPPSFRWRPKDNKGFIPKLFRTCCYVKTTTV